jgi:hypothetical protein
MDQCRLGAPSILNATVPILSTIAPSLRTPSLADP